MITRAAQQALADLPLFRTLEGAEELSDILSLARPFEAAAGSVLFRQGQEADGMYVLTEGRVAIRARIPGDTLRELGSVGPGAMLGEIGLVDREPRSAIAQASTNISGWFVSERLFRSLRMTQRPSARKVIERICLVVCERIRSRAAELARADAPPPQPWSAATGPVANMPPSPPSALDLSMLERLPFFARFGVGDRAALLEYGKLVAVPRGQVLWNEGDSPSRCYVPIRGALRLSVRRGAAGVETLIVLGPGQLAGVVGLLDRLPRATRCEVVEPAWLFEAGVNELHLLALGGSSLSLELFDAVAAALVERLRVVTRTVMRLSAQGRIRPAL